uniref:CPSF73-100_C domain-containing protein n=1 Tax=Glossina pallidipes TaxID=7398 RepID=A0A1B0A5P4_GLOPL
MVVLYQAEDKGCLPSRFPKLAHPNTDIKFYNSRNTHSVELYFRGEKTAKVMGSLAATKPEIGSKLSGVLVKRDKKYHLLAASDLSKYTGMSKSVGTQRKSSN